MTTQTIASQPRDDISPGWLWAGGIFQILLGIFAIASPMVFSVAIELVIGFGLILVGATQVAASFFNKSWGGFFMTLLMGVLFLGAGVAITWSPILGVMALTTFLGIMFFMQGVLAIVMAFQVRPKEGWGTTLVSGIAALFLALIIFAGLRTGASAAVIGIIFGVNMLFAGASLIAVARERKADA